ncbi:uncharacterized protein LOC143017737 isoform X2 [Oratosquilla oratoria]|uniref:uncharacterized protein LOC143017737 isoform X2 n=1 Tax=Oratosquilla oratoria TaxID=337810 RepID=UPI003F7695E4
MEESDGEALETEPLVKSQPADDSPAESKDAPNQESLPARTTQGSPTNKNKRNSKPRLSLVLTNEKDQRLPRDPVINDGLKGPETPTTKCSFFGVKNYLHHFYERQHVQNPNIYEDFHQEEVYLVKRAGVTSCSGTGFRWSLLLGGLILAMGAAAFIVAACTPRRATVLPRAGGGVAIVDRAAAAHNADVDAVLLVGLVAVTLGGTVLVAALVSRTFCSPPEDPLDVFRLGVVEVGSCMDEKVPANEHLTSVQPPWQPAWHRSSMPVVVPVSKSRTISSSSPLPPYKEDP